MVGIFSLWLPILLAGVVEQAAAAVVLGGPVALGERWVRATVLLDAAAVAYLKVGRPESARQALQQLRPRAARAAWNLRNTILEALIEKALAGEARPPSANGQPPGAFE